MEPNTEYETNMDLDRRMFMRALEADELRCRLCCRESWTQQAIPEPNELLEELLNRGRD